jgi:hypothetical protein
VNEPSELSVDELLHSKKTRKPIEWFMDLLLSSLYPFFHENKVGNIITEVVAFKTIGLEVSQATIRFGT